LGAGVGVAVGTTNPRDLESTCVLPTFKTIFEADEIVKF